MTAPFVDVGLEQAGIASRPVYREALRGVIMGGLRGVNMGQLSVLLGRNSPRYCLMLRL